MHLNGTSFSDLSILKRSRAPEDRHFTLEVYERVGKSDI